MESTTMDRIISLFENELTEEEQNALFYELATDDESKRKFINYHNLTLALARASENFQGSEESRIQVFEKLGFSTGNKKKESRFKLLLHAIFAFQHQQRDKPKQGR